LESNDNQCYEDVNKEEWKYYKVNDVKDGHLNAVVLDGTMVIWGGSH
jgi:hypothetical protein